MMDELIIDKKKYISSKRASKVSGYTKDYIGQLCRAGSIPSKMVGRSWYVEEDSIKKHRKTYRGEPIVDSSVWDVDHVEEDSRSLSEIASQYVDVQEKKKKEKLLDELFEFKYEKDNSHLIPKVSKSVTRTEEKVGSLDPKKSIQPEKSSSRVRTHQVDHNAKTQSFYRSKEQNKSINRQTVVNKSARVHNGVIAKNVKQAHLPFKVRKLLYPVATAGVLAVFSSVFVANTDVYERYENKYVETYSGIGISLEGLGYLAVEVRNVISSAIEFLD